MKKRIYLLFIAGIAMFFIYSCKKDNLTNEITIVDVINEPSGLYSYTDKDLTQASFVQNFLAENIAGEFNYLVNAFYYNDEKKIDYSYFFRGYIKKRSVVDSEYIYEKSSYLMLGGKKINHSNLDELPNQYFYRNYSFLDVNAPFLKDFTYINSFKLELFDTTEQKVIEFITHTPLPINANLSKRYFQASNVSGAKLTWNKDQKNKLGLFIYVLQYINGAISYKYIFTPDDGSEDISSFLEQFKGRGYFQLQIKRGAILIGEGIDGRKHRLSTITEANIGVKIDM